MRPEALQALAGVEHILHAGDIGTPGVLDALRRVAPVTAVRGNNDHGPWAEAVPEREMLELGGTWIYLLHDLAEMDIDPEAAGVQVVMAGHSHRPLVERCGGVLYVNPGSAGPRRFTLPVSVGFLDVRAGRARATLATLTVT